MGDSAAIKASRLVQPARSPINRDDDAEDLCIYYRRLIGRIYVLYLYIYCKNIPYDLRVEFMCLLGLTASDLKGDT